MLFFLSSGLGQEALTNYYLDKYKVSDDDTLLYKTSRYENGMEVGNWYFETFQNVTKFSKFVLKDSILQKSIYYHVFDGDTFVKSESSYNENGDVAMSIDYRSYNTTIENKWEYFYDDQNRLISKIWHGYDESGKETIKMWDSTFYPSNTMITHRWDIITTNGYDGNPVLEPCDTTVLKKDRFDRVIFKHRKCYTTKMSGPYSGPSSKTSYREYYHYKGKSDRLSKHISISANQHFVIKYRYHSNKKLKHYEWHESKDDWSFWIHYDTRGVPLEEVRKENGKVYWHYIYKVRSY